MAVPGVPAGLRRKVRDAFHAALKTNPHLANKRAVKTWVLWDGKSSAVEPPESELPAVQIRMLGGPTRRIASQRTPGGAMKNTNQSTITFLIDLWIAGTDSGDLADVADLIYSALDPQDDGPRAELQEHFRRVGVPNWQLTREILPTSAESYAQSSINGQGSYALDLQFFA